MTFAQCRACGNTGSRSEVSIEIVDSGEPLDQCRACGNTDVDVMSVEGLVHEANKQEVEAPS